MAADHEQSCELLKELAHQTVPRQKYAVTAAAAQVLRHGIVSTLQQDLEPVLGIRTRNQIRIRRVGH
jgi:hypothetical protein